MSAMKSQAVARSLFFIRSSSSCLFLSQNEYRPEQKVQRDPDVGRSSGKKIEENKEKEMKKIKSNKGDGRKKK